METRYGLRKLVHSKVNLRKAGLPQPFEPEMEPGWGTAAIKTALIINNRARYADD